MATPGAKGPGRIPYLLVRGEWGRVKGQTTVSGGCPVFQGAAEPPMRPAMRPCQGQDFLAGPRSVRLSRRRSRRSQDRAAVAHQAAKRPQCTGSGSSRNIWVSIQA